MATEKATYWLAVGVLALGLNSAFYGREDQWAHTFADRATAFAANLAERGLDYAVTAEAMLGRDPSQSPRMQAALARLQARTTCAQAALARQQARNAALEARLEAQKVRLELRQRQVMNVGPSADFCLRRIEVQAPDVHVDVDVPVRRLQDLKSLPGLEHLQELRALRDLPAQAGIDFSNMDFSQGPMSIEIRRQTQTDDNGPI
jgi:small-conductance mechanosensitive channel